ncbi:MAG: hypothetical protein JXA41_03265, partial [Deltaproteobacteria bacterium]|nr:hypothetical protein [Deltaproteobacteria bacterium]
MFYLLRHIINCLSSWHVYLGREIGQVQAPSIIFFPLTASVFFCGLAGILAVKGSGSKAKRKSGPDDAGEDITQRFEDCIKSDMQSILSGRLPPDAYLGGDTGLAQMAKDISLLKADSPFQTLFFDPRQSSQLFILSGKMKTFLAEEEKILEDRAGGFSTAHMELINARLIALKDITWGLEKDILENIIKIKDLAGIDRVDGFSPAAMEKYREINSLLNSLDRLEVRGRDSAGIQLSFILKDGQWYSKILNSLKQQGLYDRFLERTRPSDLVNGSISVSDENRSHEKGSAKGRAISFTYKTSSVIGELGLNIRNLREAVSADSIFREFARQAAAVVTSLAHTRWASVGSITEENCHPVNNFTEGENSKIKTYPRYGTGAWSINCVLNGDIDNYDTLRLALEAGHDLIAPELTTDTKIIPLQIEKNLFD